jgi:hypothetical protein
MTNYETKLVGIIATNDLSILHETAFHDDYIYDDNLESLLDALDNDSVINYKADFEAEDQLEAVEYLDCRTPRDHYFIAIETPVTHFYTEKSKTPCYSWGYTQTTWVFVDSLAEIDKYRQMVGKAADATLEEKEDK